MSAVDLNKAREALASGTLEDDALALLLREGTPEDWDALARLGLHDRVAALFFDSPVPLTPDTPLARGAGWILIGAFFDPRPEHALRDVARALEILVGDGSWEGLSTGSWLSPGHHEHDDRFGERASLHPPSPALWRHGHIALPAPVLHPILAARAAALAGGTPEATAALIDGEVVVEGEGLCLFPWYAEEDDKARPAALERAAALGVSLPPRFLDEPYESFFYLQRTGAPALTRLLQSHAQGLDAHFEGLLEEVIHVRHIPVLPWARRKPVLYPGGFVMPGPINAAYDALEQVRQYAEWNGEHNGEVAPEYQARLHMATEALMRSLGVLPSTPEPPHPAWEHTLTPPEPQEEAAPDAPILQDLRWAYPGTLLLIYPARLVLLDVETGGVLGTWPSWGRVLHVSAAGAVLVQSYGTLSLLDLRSGTWCGGTLRQAREQGLLQPEVFPPADGPHFGTFYDNSNAWLYDIDSPDHHFSFTCDAEWIGGVVRRADGALVAPPDAILGTGDVDEEERSHLPMLTLSPPASTGTRNTLVLGGVTFTASSPQGHSVRRGHAVALTLCNNAWRSHHDGQLLLGGKPLARLSTSPHLAAFSHNGERLAVCDSTGIYLLTWSWDGAAPRVDSQHALDPLLELFGGAP